MNSIWDQIILNNTVRAWTTAIFIIVGAIFTLRLLQSQVIRRIKKAVKKTKSGLDDFILQQLEWSGMPFLYLLSVYAGIQYLNIVSNGQAIVRAALLVVTVFFILKVVNASITYLFNSFHAHREDKQATRASRVVVIIIRVMMWFGGILFLVDNLGYDITTVVVGLGIGGIAIALASQTILADLFNYIAIFFDKPFEVGDFIVLDDKMGTVEYIGIRTTRLRTFRGEQLVCSNTDLTSARVHNYKRMNERRVDFSFGVVYNTATAKLKLIPGWIKIIIESISSTRFDRAHFKSLGDFSLQFEVAYYILTPDYNQYMDKQQQVNLLLLELFEQEGIEFAFPTQTVVFDGGAPQLTANPA